MAKISPSIKILSNWRHILRDVTNVRQIVVSLNLLKIVTSNTSEKLDRQIFYRNKLMEKESLDKPLKCVYSKLEFKLSKKQEIRPLLNEKYKGFGEAEL